MTKLEILQNCTVEGNNVRLPAGQLDRKIYLEVASALEKIGGAWKGGKVSAFEFKSDPSELLNQIAGGANVNLKKDFQYFPTPEPIADWLVELADIREEDTVLEPSAGQGAIVKAINSVYPEKQVHCYELMPTNQEILREIPTVQFIGEDFLNCKREGNLGIKFLYDRIVANPPFSKNQDIDHVRNMYDSLKYQGKMVSITSKHWMISDNKKETEFREWLNTVGAEIHEIEAGAFKSSGTVIETVALVITKNYN